MFLEQMIVIHLIKILHDFSVTHTFTKTPLNYYLETDPVNLFTSKIISDSL